VSGYVQIGVTALRAPGTGEFLPAVPLYIRAEDAEGPYVPKDDGGLWRELGAKMKEYHEAAMAADQVGGRREKVGGFYQSEE